ncbi:hypothetical protein CWB72_09485 [Pseudoalteromonas phenolica]|uniref:putative Ig domain-containing protein n=1 Tax=Pseudoalteromonas phenolica TaxID=161398 RepID=UPI00110A26FB|nr:putative Ig domain-containing protein [Pseudoalteromonas phenolica]TMN90147.1 hypothetical protein CWB72_09485 [Pseudoalteromonas phenolica]
MKKTNQATLLLVALLGLTACGGGNSNETQNDVKQDQSNTQPQKKEITIVGSVEKGPFVIGSTVTINILNENGENTDSTIVTKTTDDLGNFEFKVPAGSIIEISASGYYRNEITGGLSEGELTLRSIYQASEVEKQNANVNLLTHLTSNRVLELIKAGESSFEEAIQRAEQEFTTNFKNVISSSSNANFASLSIYKDENAEASAYLLALSSMFYQHAINTAKSNQTSADAELTVALNELESDFGTDGKVDNQDVLTAIKETQKLIDPSQVQQNLFDWVTGKEQYAVPDINEFLDTDLDGIANNKDNDDDNDGIADEDDSSPHLADFIVEDKNISVLEDESITLDLTTNAPLGDEVKIIATQVKGPTNGELSGYFPEITYTPFNDFNGQDKFTLTLFQDGIESKPFTINVDIKAVNDAPTIEGQPEVDIIANNEYSFSPSISDIEDSQLTVTVENLPEWLTLDSSTGMLQGTPTNAQVATYSNIQMSVSDGTTTSQLPAFSIDVHYSTLAAPTNLQQTSSTKEKLQEIKLKWEQVDFAKSYTLEISLFEDFRTILQTETIETNSITLEKEPNHYYWRVSTVNPNGETGFSSEIMSLQAGVFTKKFGGIGQDSSKKTIPTKDGGFITLATTASNDLLPNGQGEDDWIFKVDSNGEVVWQYFSVGQGRDRLRDIILLNDDSLIAVGQDWAQNKAIALKLSPEGTLDWEIYYRPEEYSNRFDFASVLELENTIYVLSQLWKCEDNFCSWDKAFIHTVSSETGEVTAPKPIPEVSGVVLSPKTLKKTNDNNLLVAGDLELTESGYQTKGAYIQVLDLDLNVELFWSNENQFVISSFHDVVELNDGSFVVLGNGSFELSAAAIATIDSKGNTISQREFTNIFNSNRNILPEESGHFWIPSINTNNTLTSFKFDTNLKQIEEVNHQLSFENSIIRSWLRNSDGTSTFNIFTWRTDKEITLIKK